MTRSLRLQTHVTSLHPDVLEIIDESSQHSVPKGSESHFKMVIVSNAFSGLARLARHRLVNRLVESEFSQGLHALSLFLYTPKEWEESQHPIPDSPVCHGGSRHQ